LSAQQPRERANFGGHAAVVSSIALTPDGKTLATGSYDATIKIWDLNTYNETAILRGHTAGIYSVAIAADGKTLASGSHDDTARIWDVATGKELAVLKHRYHVKRVAFTPHGRALLTAGEGPIKLWDLDTAEELATFDLVMEKANVNLVLCMAVTADGALLCTGHGDGKIILWDVKRRKKMRTIQTNDRTSDKHVPSVTFSPDGKTVACGIGYGVVKLWDTASGEEKLRIDAHRTRVWGLAISPDGKALASGGWDGKVKLWDMDTGKERGAFLAHKDRVYALAFTPDGQSLVSGGGIQFKRGEAKLWDLAAILKSPGDRE
jgi:WD40 repeat protein